MKLSGLARSTYYYYLKQQGTDKYCVVKQKIEKIFTENKQRYGYRRILLVLRQQGIKLNHKTVHKLMRSMGLHGKRRKSKYKSYKGEVGKVAANILSRDFAADKPFEKLPQGARPILHSDQGWQYQMKEFQRQLKEHNIIQSMSRKGNCLDNSVMENFFGRLKVEMYYGEKFQTVDEFVHCLKEYIHYWNNERISLTLNGMSPVQYRTHSQAI